MGLDAVVYKNIENLPEPQRAQVKLVDPLTGELDFANGPTLALRTEDLFAAQVRVGNISSVAWIREQIESRWADKCPLILNAILYSGTHSGDFIPLEQVRGIKLEIAGLDCTDASISAKLSTFLEQITQLVIAAEIEANPIVFQ
jgi:hypothetical protein